MNAHGCAGQRTGLATGGLFCAEVNGERITATRTETWETGRPWALLSARRAQQSPVTALRMGRRSWTCVTAIVQNTTTHASAAARLYTYDDVESCDGPKHVHGYRNDARENPGGVPPFHRIRSPSTLTRRRRRRRLGRPPRLRRRRTPPRRSLRTKGNLPPRRRR